MKERIYTEIKKLDNTCIKVEKQLEDNKKEFFKKQYTCINSFWENERLYESNCQFILNPFISHPRTSRFGGCCSAERQEQADFHPAC